MNSVKRMIGYFVAFLLIVSIAGTLFISFQRFGLWTFFYIPEAVILLMCFYVFFPVVLFFLGYPKIKRMFISTLPPTDKYKNFLTVLIPAHNEERVLPMLLESLNKQTYSKDHFQVIVVADRCRDNTAAIAKKF